MFFKVSALFLLVCLLAGCKTESGDSADITVSEVLPLGTNSMNYKAMFIDDPRYNEQIQMPVQFSVPNACTAANKCALQLYLHPYTSHFPLFCNSNGPRSELGSIVISNCSDSEGNTGHGWWGPGQAGKRMGVSANKAVELFASRINFMAGMTLTGASQGGLGSILHSMRWVDESWRRHITVVDAAIHDWFFVAPDGYYWRNPGIAKTWAGYDIALLDVESNMAAGRLDRIYYKLFWNSDDTTSNPRNAEFHILADQHGIATFGVWTKNGHSPVCEKGINLPCSQRFSGPFAHSLWEFQPLLDKAYSAFCHSSANRACDGRGHHNLGLERDYINTVDAVDRLQIPIRYRQHTGTGSACLEQPPSATFSLTLRDQLYNKFKFVAGEVVHVRVGDTHGAVLIQKTGEVTIPGITLPSSASYTNVEVWR